VKTNSLTRRPAFRAFTVLTLLLLVVADYLFYRDKIYPGVYLYDINVSGLTKTQAYRLAQSRLEKENLSDKPVLFNFNERTWTYTYRELGATVDIAD
jgi:hypothetical protein